MRINIDEVVAEFGSYYVDGGQGMQNLQTVLMQRSVFTQSFPLLPTDSTVVYKATASIKRVLQAFQRKFTPIAGNEVKFELEKIELDRVKIDELISPDEIMPSWLGFLAENKLERKDWPIVRYISEQLIVKQYYADLELLESFKGVKGVIVDGTATAAGTSLNGVRKKIRDGFAAGKTKQIVLGAMPTDPVQVADYIENFVKNIPDLIRTELSEVSVSLKVERLYREGVRKKYNLNYEQKTNLSTLIDDPQITVKGYPAMDGSDLIFTTPKFNKANPMKAGDNQGRFDVQKQDRDVKLLSDWWIGLGFWYLPYVYHNDQDLVAA